MSQDFGDLILKAKQRSAIGHRLTNALGQGNTMIGEQRPRIEDALMIQGETNLYFGKYFVSQNSLRWGSPTFSYDITLPSTEEVFQICGNIDFLEYSGSFRGNLRADNFNLRVDNLMIFAKGGYGWSWYRLKDVSTNDELLSNRNGTWVNKPTLHFGGGIEWVICPNFIKNFKDFPSDIDMSIQCEGLFYWHSLRDRHRGRLPHFVGHLDQEGFESFSTHHAACVKPDTDGRLLMVVHASRDSLGCVYICFRVYGY